MVDKNWLWNQLNYERSSIRRLVKFMHTLEFNLIVRSLFVLMCNAASCATVNEVRVDEFYQSVFCQQKEAIFDSKSASKKALLFSHWHLQSDCRSW